MNYQRQSGLRNQDICLPPIQGPAGEKRGYYAYKSVTHQQSSAPLALAPLRKQLALSVSIMTHLASSGEWAASWAFAGAGTYRGEVDHETDNGIRHVFSLCHPYACLRLLSQGGGEDRAGNVAGDDASRAQSHFRTRSRSDRAAIAAAATHGNPSPAACTRLCLGPWILDVEQQRLGLGPGAMGETA